MQTSLNTEVHDPGTHCTPGEPLKFNLAAQYFLTVIPHCYIIYQIEELLLF